MRHRVRLPGFARESAARRGAPAAIALIVLLAALLPASGMGPDVSAREPRAASQPRVGADTLGAGLRLLAYAEKASGGAPPAALAALGAPHDPQPAADFIWPVDGWVVQGMWAGHPTGIDIGAHLGDPIRAIRAGTVVFAGGDPCCEYGYHVVIQHDEGWSSLYGHMTAFTVRAGQHVEQGQTIGSVGSTGKSSGPHVHLELRSLGAVVDPLDYLYPHRDAPPPDPADVAALAVRRAALSPAEAPPPAPTPTAQRRSDGLTAAQAAAYAANWLASQPSAAYDVAASSCAAVPRGPNWAVTCIGTPIGCYSSVCATPLTACVYEQPFLISTSCP